MMSSSLSREYDACIRTVCNDTTIPISRALEDECTSVKFRNNLHTVPDQLDCAPWSASVTDYA